jgi:hypothetical protein
VLGRAFTTDALKWTVILIVLTVLAVSTETVIDFFIDGGWLLRGSLSYYCIEFCAAVVKLCDAFLFSAMVVHHTYVAFLSLRKPDTHVTSWNRAHDVELPCSENMWRSLVGLWPFIQPILLHRCIPIVIGTLGVCGLVTGELVFFHSLIACLACTAVTHTIISIIKKSPNFFGGDDPLI